MRNLAVMQVEIVGRGVVRLQNCKILRGKMWVRLLAWVNGEKKRQVGIVGVEQVHLAKVLGVVARNGRKQGIELVIGLCKERTVGVREHAGKLAHLLIDRLEVGTLQQDRQ